MSRTYRRPALRQHKELQEGKYRARVEKNKKKQNKNKHPKRDIDGVGGFDTHDWFNNDSVT